MTHHTQQPSATTILVSSRISSLTSDDFPCLRCLHCTRMMSAHSQPTQIDDPLYSAVLCYQQHSKLTHFFTHLQWSISPTCDTCITQSTQIDNLPYLTVLPFQVLLGTQSQVTLCHQGISQLFLALTSWLEVCLSPALRCSVDQTFHPSKVVIGTPGLFAPVSTLAHSSILV